MNIGLLILGWGLYFFLHSFLAADSSKEVASQKFAISLKNYRLIYVVFSSIGLLALLFMNANIPAQEYFNSHGVARYLSLVFAAFGVIIIKAAFRSYKFSSFIGVESEEEAFVTTGILNSIRHPIYSGTLLMIIGYWLFSPNLPTLVSVLCIVLYLPIGIYLEERKLTKKFGDQYLDYKRKVPSLFPRLF